MGPAMDIHDGTKHAHAALNDGRRRAGTSVRGAAITVRECRTIFPDFASRLQAIRVLALRDDRSPD